MGEMTPEELRGLPCRELQRVYTAYPEEQGFAAGTIAAARNSAFSRLKHEPSLDFWALLEREDFEAAAAERLRATLRQRGSRNVAGNLNGYPAHLRRFRRFALSEEAGKRPAVRKRREGPDLPMPCPEEVRRYLAQWRERKNYQWQEEALGRLFQDYAPGNRDIRDILLKAAALNAFCSANIFSIFPLAEHILALDIDQRLSSGDPGPAEDLKTVEDNGKVRRFYSFATKYCRYHRPEEFPLSDHYVAVTLRHLGTGTPLPGSRMERRKTTGGSGRFCGSSGAGMGWRCSPGRSWTGTYGSWERNSSLGNTEKRDRSPRSRFFTSRNWPSYPGVGGGSSPGRRCPPASR